MSRQNEIKARVTRQKRSRESSASLQKPDDEKPEPKKPIKRAKRVTSLAPVQIPAAAEAGLAAIKVQVEPPLPQTQGALYTFGSNVCCQLGIVPENNKPIEKRKFPALVKTLHDDKIGVQFVAAGGMHTVALTDDGKVYTFGSNDEGALGRPIDEENEEKETSTPRMVNLPGKAICVSAGSSHSAALTEDGVVYCWGTFRDGNGHFGLIPGDDKEKENVLHKTPVKLELDTVIKSIASGNDHMVLLTEAGKVLTFGACWEVLGRTQLIRKTRSTGDRSEKDFMLTPTEAHFPARKKFSHIWAGSSCTFCKEGNKAGIVWAFGMNSQKQLGIDQDTPYIASPTKSTAVTKESFTKIAVGEFHCLGLNPEGKVFSWGKPHEGQLGLGDGTPDESISTPQHVAALTQKTVSIACGHSVSYALTKDSRLFSWGFGENWQLGYGEEDDKNVPEPVLAKIRGEPASQIRFIAAGGQHASLIGDFGLGMAMEVD